MRIKTKSFVTKSNYSLLPSQKEEPKALLEKPKPRKRFSILSFFLTFFILCLVIFCILLFFYKPLINLRSHFIKNISGYVQNKTKPVFEIDSLKNKIQLVQEQAKGWNSNAYLAIIDQSNDPTFKPTNFSTDNTYHFIFMNPNNEAVIFFVNHNDDKIIGNIKIDMKSINIPSENNSSLDINKLKFVSDDIFPVVEVNGLKSFLNRNKDAELKIGPVLEYSNRYNTNYWLYIYNTPDNKHKFMAKVSADNGKILEVSQR